MEIRNQRCDGVLVVSVSARLDAVSAPAFDAHCRQAIEQGERALILDFATSVAPACEAF